MEYQTPAVLATFDADALWGDVFAQCGGSSIVG
jgi:hypothetical protein